MYFSIVVLPAPVAWWFYLFRLAARYTVRWRLLYRVAQNKSQHFIFILRHVLNCQVSWCTAAIDEKCELHVKYFSDLWVSGWSSWRQIILLATFALYVALFYAPPAVAQPLTYVLPVISCRHLHADLPEHTPGARPALRAPVCHGAL